MLGSWQTCACGKSIGSFASPLSHGVLLNDIILSPKYTPLESTLDIVAQLNTKATTQGCENAIHLGPTTQLDHIELNGLGSRS